MLGEHPAEQFIIGKSMTLQDLLQRIPRRDEILINAGQPEFILIFQKRKSHVFFEKTAEIPGFQKGNPGDLVDGDGAVIVPGGIA